jgi:hypothetical protein
MQTLRKLVDLLLRRRDGSQGGARAGGLQELMSQLGKDMIQPPHGRTLELRRREATMQLRTQLFHPICRGVSRPGRGGRCGYRSLMMSVSETQRECGREGNGCRQGRHSVTPAEPPTVTVREAEPVDAARYIAVLKERDR